jgi:rod shape-determining protein MreC
MTRKNDSVIDTLLSIVNPIKQTYTNMTRDVEDKSKSYLYQQQHIEELTKINLLLGKYLLNQKHYIQQVQDLYEKIPSLEKLPKDSVEIIQTISYVKLNSFSQIILTKPDYLSSEDGILFGLIQDDVVAGVAEIKNNNLYGSLTSNDKCRFSVFVGDKKIPGVAIGMDTKRMVVKFIPTWSDIKKGDRVITSGIDNIFFANIPVGIVESVKTLSNYKVAYINSFADILHPDYFYLITDASVSFVSDCRYKNMNLSSSGVKKWDISDNNISIVDVNISNQRDVNYKMISSIPSLLIDEEQEIIQTTEEEVSPKQLEVPVESLVPHKKYKPKRKYKVKKKPKKRPKRVIKRVQPKDYGLEVF